MFQQIVVGTNSENVIVVKQFWFYGPLIWFSPYLEPKSIINSVISLGVKCQILMILNKHNKKNGSFFKIIYPAFCLNQTRDR